MSRGFEAGVKFTKGASTWGACVTEALKAYEKDPTLKIMKGPPGGSGDTAHFWTVRQDGTVFDPAAQTVGDGYPYREGRVVDVQKLKEDYAQRGKSAHQRSSKRSRGFEAGVKLARLSQQHGNPHPQQRSWRHQHTAYQQGPGTRGWMNPHTQGALMEMRHAPRPVPEPEGLSPTGTAAALGGTAGLAGAGIGAYRGFRAQPRSVWGGASRYGALGVGLGAGGYLLGRAVSGS